MAYCSESHVQNAVAGAKRLVKLADYDGDGAADSGVVDDAIAEGDAMIDSYVQKRFSVPVSPIPNALKFMSARMARYYLEQRKGMLTDKAIQAYDNDLRTLRDVSEGIATLGIEPLSTKSPDYVGAAHSDRPTAKAVSRKKMDGFS